MTKVNANNKNNHIIFLYSDDSERLDFIVNYFSEGISSGFACVFVSSDPEEKVINDFMTKGFDVTGSVERGVFKIFNMNDTYLPNGEFISSYMLSNVEQFIEDAKKDGYVGVYTAGDMTWLLENSSFLPEAIFYENRINDLQTKHENFTGLCLYPWKQSRFISSLALATHPEKVFKNKVTVNNDYQTASH